MKGSNKLVIAAAASLVASWFAGANAAEGSFLGVWWGITSVALLFATLSTLIGAAIAYTDEQSEARKEAKEREWQEKYGRGA